jgi:hypothetical protein
MYTKSRQNVPGILWHRRFGAPWVRIAWTESYWSFLCASFAEEAARHVAGRDSGSCVTITHRATHRLLCRHPTTVLSGSRSEWLLAVLYSENGPRGGVSKPRGTSSRMRRPNSRRLPKTTSAGVSNNGRVDVASVCVCVRARKVLLRRCLGKRCRIIHHYNAIAQFRELSDCPSHMQLSIHGHVLHCHPHILRRS